jgi:L,D-transpeptidase ErfK/SrfK
MTVSHGCVRLYPEDIQRLYSKTPVGTAGRFVYEPIKFGWRGASLFVEIHDDLYGKYPGMWYLSQQLVKAQGLGPAIDNDKLEKAVEAKSGIPTYVGLGEEPPAGAIPYEGMPGPPANPAPGAETASSTAPPAADTTNPPPPLDATSDGSPPAAYTTSNPPSEAADPASPTSPSDSGTGTNPVPADSGAKPDSSIE